MFFRRKRAAQPPVEATPPPVATRAGEPAQGATRPPETALGASPAAAAGSATAAAPTTQFLTGDHAADRRTVQVLLEAIARVSGAQDLDSLLVDIVDRSIEITGAERGLLVLCDVDGVLSARVARVRGARPAAADVRFSTTIARRVVEQVQPVRATVQSESEALELGQSVFDLKLRAVMCVPLVATGAGGAGGAGAAARGALYVDSRAASRQFSQRDLGLFAALAQHISIALENARLHVDSIEKLRLEQSLTIASAIQRDLMPPMPASQSGWDLAAWYAPAEKAAGDFYDFARLKDGRQVVVVGDGTGHGIGPALITASAQGSLRSYLRLLTSPAEALTLLNQDLCERIEDGRFVTVLTAALQADGEVEVVDAGHGEALVWRAATGETRPLGRGGPALGMMPGATYEVSERLQLERGDALFLYSDGIADLPITERAEERVGEAGVARAFAAAAGRPGGAADVLARFRADVLAHAPATFPDDITLVVVRRA